MKIRFFLGIALLFAISNLSIGNENPSLRQCPTGCFEDNFACGSCISCTSQPCPTGCVTSFVCPGCNPCVPTCLLSGCFSTDSSGNVNNISGGNFTITGNATTGVYTVTFTQRPFCGQLAVTAIASSLIEGVVSSVAISIDASQPTNPASSFGLTLEPPLNHNTLVCFFAVPIPTI